MVLLGQIVLECPLLNLLPSNIYLFGGVVCFTRLWPPFHRWKIHEACMLALGSVKSIITDSVKSGRIHFDMHGFLTNVILADLNLSGMCQHSARLLEDL